MFFSKKWVFILLSFTGILFMLLLMIQFRWIGKTVEIDRQRFENTVRRISGRIRESVFSDTNFRKTYLMASEHDLDFLMTGRTGQNIESTLKNKVDSVLKADHAPLSSKISGRIGAHCYLMRYSPIERRNADIDNSQFKVCLCHEGDPKGLDLGINLSGSPGMNGIDPAGLILPSVFLILLLIGLFTYAIFIIKKQKKIAESKNDFINNLTHEFNTPLFSIGITSTLLLKSNAIYQSDKLKKYVDLIVTEKNRIQNQVDKMLRLTALESGGIIMDMEIIDVHTVLEEAIQSFEAIALQKLGLITFYPNAIDRFAKGDRVHLFNAFSNLLDNSCKYTNNAPEIYIATHNTNNKVIITIADNGIGIKKDEAKMIFNKFYRVKQGDRHDTKGFGIGLNYVNKIIELHGGSVEVRSEPGKGSVFILYLPSYNQQ